MKDKLAICILVLVILAFLFPLVTLNKSFVGGDNFVQFYPWYKAYSASLASGTLPFWVSGMQSGFPLMAEGQVGGYYPLNLAIFYLLPFNIAYNYSIIMHFILGGIFIFMYMRQLNIKPEGSLFGSILFCFGGSYAGCFYNIVTLKTFIWFPLVLFLIERYFQRRQNTYLFLSAVFFGIQLLAGFAQVAVYSGFFYLVYYIVRAIEKKEKYTKLFLNIFIFLALSFLVFLPQFFLTSNLIANSTRALNASLGFALWGSFPPIGFLGLIFPYSVSFLRAVFYVTTIGFILSIFALVHIKESRDKRYIPLIVILIVSIFFSLGEYNPLYVMAIKIFKLYSLRGTIKFLFFGIFAFSVLSGLGFSILSEMSDKAIRQARRLALNFLIALSSLFILIKICIAFFGELILKLGLWYVQKFIVNKPYHRYGYDYYKDTLKGIYDVMREATSLHNMHVIGTVIFVLIGFLLCLWFREKTKINARFKIIVFLIMISELITYSAYGTGFRGNIKPFNILIPENQKIFKYIKDDKDIFRIYPYNLLSGNLPNWSFPNANLNYGVESIASYTPLTEYRYWSKLKELGAVDDSLGFFPVSPGVVDRDIDILRILNVKYVVSPELLKTQYLEKVEEDGGRYLYRLKDHFPRFFFTEGLKDIRPLHDVDIEVIKNTPTELRFRVRSDTDGYFVISQNYNGSWKAYINGKKANILKIREIVPALFLNKGSSYIEFIFYPYAKDS